MYEYSDFFFQYRHDIFQFLPHSGGPMIFGNVFHTHAQTPEIRKFPGIFLTVFYD